MRALVTFYGRVAIILASQQRFSQQVVIIGTAGGLRLKKSSSIVASQ